MIDTNKVISVIKNVIMNFIKKDYETLLLKDCLKRHTVKELQLAIDEYPGVLSYPSEEAFELLDIYEINKSEVNVDFDLWFNNEKSDLTIGLYIKETNGSTVYGIQSIHVL